MDNKKKNIQLNEQTKLNEQEHQENAPQRCSIDNNLQNREVILYHEKIKYKKKKINLPVYVYQEKIIEVPVYKEKLIFNEKVVENENKPKIKVISYQYILILLTVRKLNVLFVWMLMILKKKSLCYTNVDTLHAEYATKNCGGIVQSVGRKIREKKIK